ncbi:MAG: hypothetical protein ACK4OJ_07655 [Brevundimonas sp.]
MVGVACGLLGMWPASSFADPAEERRLAEQYVYAWPDPYPKPELSRGARMALQNAFGDRMTPYAWHEAELALSSRVVSWAEAQSHMVDAYVEEFTESELRQLANFVSSPAFRKFAPHVLEFHKAASEEEKMNLIVTHLTPEEVLELVPYASLLARAREYDLQIAATLAQQNAGEYRSRLMARCPGRTQPIPWCEN